MVKRRISATAHAILYELSSQTAPRLSTGQIHAEVNRRLNSKEQISLRTVQRLVSEIRPAGSRPWRVEDAATPDEATSVLDVMRELLDAVGSLVALPREIAEWIVIVRRAAPDLEARAVLQVATIYYVSRQDGRGTADVDAWLAFAPWRDNEQPSRYRRAVARGLQAFDAAPWVEGIPNWWEDTSNDKA